MDRYCLETDVQHKKVIIHNQHCALYHDGQLLRLNLAQDLGEHAHQRAALKTALESFPAARPCAGCLSSLR